jgi:tetratricopeptide (TPR) repeat protein
MNQQQESANCLQQAMERHRAGDLHAADQLYAETLRLDADNAQAMRLRGALARERGDFDTSLSYLQQACKLAPDDPEPLSEIALTCMATGDIPGAEYHLRKCLSLAPDFSRATANLGAVLQQRGHIKAAIDCYRKTLTNAEDTFVRCNLARALSDAGDFAAALETCDEADENGQPMLLATRGAILLDQHRYEEALEILTTASQLAADDMTCINLAFAQQQTGDVKAAVTTLTQATAQNPANARAVADLANCLCALDNPEAALKTCEDFLSRYPGERLVVGSYALALHNAGRTSEALELTDCDALVRVFECTAPRGIASTQIMNHLLSAELHSNSSRLLNPVSKATSGGEQTAELNLDESLALKALQEFIRDCVSKTANDFIDKGYAQHPAMTPAQGDLSIRAWGTLLTQGGQQTSHMHPLGWLSGVYYPHLPADMHSSDPQAGWLEFNTPPERFYVKTATKNWRYEPQAGRLILFPSWFWHRTLPFESADKRISIAFDVVPTAALRML